MLRKLATWWIKQIKGAVDAELATKGLTTVEGDYGNTYIGYQPAACQERQFNSYSTGWGMGPGWGGAWYGGMRSITTYGSPARSALRSRHRLTLMDSEQFDELLLKPRGLM